MPYLLLKDQLESEMDSSGNTALHHMCSHNSPYLPLYLSTLPKGDPILNRKSKMGHSPLDVAGLYCPLEVIELMKEKGAIDEGNVDHWSIQGGNIANWSGRVDEKKPYLMHWAAYNDLPDVLVEYHRTGANLSFVDTNGHSSIDLTVLNKSYKSFKVLADLGFRPKPDLLANSDSVSMRKYIADLDQPASVTTIKTYMKVCTLPILMALCIYISYFHLTLAAAVISLVLWLYLLLVQPHPEPYLNDDRNTSFQSELLKGATINRNNYLLYMLLHLAVVIATVSALAMTTIHNHVQALVFLVLLGAGVSYGVQLLVLSYGVMKNLTYSEMFDSHKWGHPWGRIKYIQERQMVVREYSNPYDRGSVANISDFLFR